MCGISGFCNLNQNYLLQKTYWETQLTRMGESLLHRGIVRSAPYLKEHAGFSHAIINICDTAPDAALSDRPRREYAIICDGELYNRDELLPALSKVSPLSITATDAEILLAAFLHYGPSFVLHLNGVFAFAIWDNAADTLYLYRDRAGIKPLFYSIVEDTFVFGSEQKTLFCHPDVTPRINRNSMQEVLALGPAHTSGNGVFCDVHEVLPGHYLTFTRQELTDTLYWDITAKEHTDSYADTVDYVSFLVRDAIKRQMSTNAALCSFLSGGIDSSIVTAIAAGQLKEKGKTLDTFSFDFAENDIYFQSNSFQPERDLPYINIMLSHCHTNHTYLTCDETTLAGLLTAAVDARDVPGMTDVDASLLYFCRLVAKQDSVALTGECADEIFGGYPWFYRSELLHRDGFPWSADISARTAFLDESLCKELQLDEYSYSRYQDSLAKAPVLAGESAEEKRRRAIAYLNIKWFMQTLLDRMDRMGMHSGLKARVPFADYRIMEYVFNVPWEMKYQNGVEKTLLRDACADLLPPELLHRKKSPYPKTYHPGYEKLLEERLTEIINNPNAPAAPLIDRKKALHFIASHKELGKPWYGQLMAGPQLMAYFIQINYWMEKYHLSL